MEFFSNQHELNSIHDDCWRFLEHSVTDRSSGWRLPSLATVADGVARQRTVVLRKIATDNRSLFVHTDRRSAKMLAIQQQPAVSMLFYDHKRQVQLQIAGTATIHCDDFIADELWSSEPEASLRAYLGPLAPGTPVSEPQCNVPDPFQQQLPSRSDLLPGRKNFAVIGVRIHSFECLLLRPEGNLRSHFGFDGSDKTTSSWLIP